MGRGFIDTIAAPITPPGRGAIAVVRVSGPSAYQAVGRLFDPWPENPEPRKAIFGALSTGDDGLATPFPEGSSYTGEETVEISLHGSPASVRLLMDVLYEFDVRPAEPGEFTLRAFLNGRMDLTQAEGVRETVDAATEAQLRLAERLRTGKLSSSVSAIRRQVLSVLAAVEASTDFSDEVGDLNSAEAIEECRLAIDGLDALISSAKSAQMVREGLHIAIVGQPNAGKSSLLNTLLGSDRAIVTEIPGTTRDTLEEMVEIGGVPCIVIDTAGMRDADGHVEKLGVERSIKAADSADHVWMIYDAEKGWTVEDEQILESIHRPAAVLANKCDLQPKPNPQRGHPISAKTGEGLDFLIEMIAKHAEDAEVLQAAVLPRHAPLLAAAKTSIEETIETLEGDVPTDLAAVTLQKTIRILGELTGESASPDVIQEIFSTFCIGK